LLVLVQLITTAPTNAGTHHSFNRVVAAAEMREYRIIGRHAAPPTQTAALATNA
jgi:hypothetical protein